MIDVGCYHCGTQRSSPYATENGFTLVRCGGCGLLYVTPRPAEGDIARAHQLGVHPGEALLDTTGEFVAAKVTGYLAVLADLFPEGLRSGRRTWLDIGCGHGEFLAALAEFGGPALQLTGLEPNARKRQAARARGLPVEDFDLAACSRQYDYISLLNVYSHLPDPPAFLAACRLLLAPGGEMLLETGDVAHLRAGEMFRPMYLPDHLSFASEAILREILDRCGFEVIAVRKYPFIPFSLRRLRKELVRLLRPGRPSALRHLLSRRYRTDMYLRARLGAPTEGHGQPAVPP